MPLVAAGSRARKVREGLPGLVRAFNEHDLLKYASAISFQALSAIVPFLLFALGPLGFLDLRASGETTSPPKSGRTSRPRLTR